MSAVPLDWAHETSPRLADTIGEDPIAMVPVGSIEQHGGHLPVGTDTFAAEAVVREAARRWDAERPLLVLPAVWTGLSPHHMGLAGSITLRSDTFLALLEDICVSLLHHGVQRIVLVNGHGGNDSAMDVVLARLGERGLPTERIAALTYWRLVAHRAAELRESGSGGTGHAGEFETSLMLATHGTSVRMEEAIVAYPKLPSAYLTTDLFESSRVRRYVPFDQVSPSGTFGDPSLADESKGQRILEVCSQELLSFLKDFSAW